MTFLIVFAYYAALLIVFAGVVTVLEPFAISLLQNGKSRLSNLYASIKSSLVRHVF